MGLYSRPRVRGASSRGDSRLAELLDEAVDLYEVDFVVEGDVARELVAAVEYVAMDFGSLPRFSGSICMTQISSGFARGSSRTGGFWEKRPSQYTPPSVRTALNRVGSAVEARIVSAETLSLRLLKALRSPERTSTAPTRSIGAGLCIGVSRSSKPTCLSSVLLNGPWVQKATGVLYGLTEGSTTEPCSRFTQTIQSFHNLS
jgi:hypothetical protein